MVVLKLILIVAFISISVQDIRERLVYWFLFPVVGAVASALFYKSTLPELFITSVITNLSFVIALFGVIYMYAKLKLKTKFKFVFGLGDALFFMALAFSFSTVSFIVVLVFSLIFSLVVHLLLKKRQKIKTIPLAGYMSVFFVMIYLSYWMGFTNNLYAL